MRIGIDMLGAQSPGSRGRGVGRYGSNLVHGLLQAGGRHEFVLYSHAGLPDDAIPAGPGIVTRSIAPEPARGEAFARQATARLSAENPDDVDWLLTLNPFELEPGYDAAPRLPGGPRTAVVVHDLIPFLFHDHYLGAPQHAAWMYRRLRQLRHDDLILANSESTRRDTLARLLLPEHRVETIGGAADVGFFRPDSSEPMPALVRGRLHRLGIRQAYLLALAGADPRKNLEGLLRAFALLPGPMLEHLQLVVTCHLGDAERAHYLPLADSLGVVDRLVLTGVIDDETLRVLYQRCAAFVFPSIYEGLGLPLLEALACGAPVVAGDNSSQPEVVGDAGLLIDASDPAAISRAIGRVLADTSLTRRLRRAGPERAACFSWERTATRALDAMEAADSAGRVGRRRGRPRIAMLSPWPPKRSGISDYSARLVGALAREYEIDLIHEPGYVPEPALRGRYSAHDSRLLDRLSRSRGYRGVVFQMGNSFYHDFLYKALLKHEGIVVLHDFNLAGFHWWRSNVLGGDPMAHFADEVRYCYPERASEIVPQLEAWRNEPGSLQEAFTRRRLYLNRRIFERARAVVVHSPWCLEQVRREWPELAARTVVIRQGARPAPVEPRQRSETRARFGLPQDALVLGCFGILSQAKMNIEAIDAFAELCGERPETLLLFVGQDWENGQARRRVHELGLDGRVRFLGRQDDRDFEALIAASDVGISLRRPPTYGETSAALLDLLRHGLPAVVIDTDTFSDYPDDVVAKVRWETEGLPGLVRAIRSLADEPETRAQLGARGFAYVAGLQTWPQVAGQYAELIERLHVERKRGLRPLRLSA